VSNGSFESGDYDSNEAGPGTTGWETIYPGDIDIDDWTVGLDSVDWIGGWNAAEGDLSVDLSGDAVGSVSQILSTTAGSNYLVSFDLSGNSHCGSVIKTVNVEIDGTTESFTFDSSLNTSVWDVAWIPQWFSFTATSGSSALTFTSATAGACGPAIDNVSVVGTPLPLNTSDCKKGHWASYEMFKNQGDCVSYVATDGKNQPSG
jgi:choice-of-anchor C domain-containing protein